MRAGLGAGDESCFTVSYSAMWFQSQKNSGAREGQKIAVSNTGDEAHFDHGTKTIERLLRPSCSGRRLPSIT